MNLQLGLSLIKLCPINSNAALSPRVTGVGARRLNKCPLKAGLLSSTLPRTPEPLRLSNYSGRIMKVFVFLFSVFLLSACSSGQVVITKAPLDKFEKLGRTEGTGCGTMLLGPAYSNFLPAMLNSRYERAYNEAVSNVRGATGLTDVTLQESWFWWVIGTTRCATVAGEAIR